MVQDLLIGFQKYFPQIRFTVLALQYPYFVKRYKWNNIEVISLAGSNEIGLKKFYLWRQALKIIMDLNIQHPFTSIHSLWLGETALLGNRASKRFKIPHINTLMGQDVLPENNYVAIIDLKKIKLVAVSKFQDDTFWHSSANRADVIIPWGIENKLYTEVDRDIHLLGAGSLIELKNYQLFINLVKKLSSNFPDLKCVIAGDGEEKLKLEKFVIDLSLEDNIQLTGNISREQLFELMSRSRIFVHPSKYESFGYVFAEALVYGMNILSRKTGAAIESEKWFTVDTEEEFYHLAKKMLESDLSFNSINPFPLKNTVEMYEDIYE